VVADANNDGLNDIVTCITIGVSFLLWTYFSPVVGDNGGGEEAIPGYNFMIIIAMIGVISIIMVRKYRKFKQF